MITDVAKLQIRVDSLEVQLAEQRLQKLHRSGKTASGGMSALGGTFGKLAGAIGGAYAAQRLLSAGFNNIRAAEKLNAMLITATGSAEGAKIAMSELSKLAVDTPFTLEGLTESFIKLKNLGLDPSEEALISYGETASSMGRNIEDVVRAVGQATVGEFESLKSFGIKARIEGDKISFIFGGVKTTVENNAAEIQKYLVNLGNENFAGSMALQMDTINGKLSNLSDAFFQFSVAVGDSGLGAAVAEALDIPISFLDRAALGLKEAKLDLTKATVGDLQLINDLIKRNEAIIASAPSRTTIASPNSAFANVNSTMAASNAQDQNELLLLKQKELEALKKQQEAQQAIKEAEERRLQFSDLLTAAGQKRSDQLRMEMGDATLLAEIEAKRLDLLNKAANGEAGNPQDAIDAVIKLEEQYDKLNQTIEKNNEAEQARLDTVTDFLKTESELRREAYEERRQIIMDTVADEELAAQLINQLNRKEFSDRLKGARGFFDDLQALSGGANEKIFKIQRGLAIATATVDGVQAVQKAASAAPFPYNIPGIIVETARAAASVAAITSTQFTGNYATGGIIPGSSYSGDNLTANVNSGEMVLNRAQQNRLFSMANGGGQGSSRTNVVIHNYGNDKVSAKQSEDGKTLEIIVGQVEKRIERGVVDGSSSFARSMQGVYNLRRNAS